MKSDQLIRTDGYQVEQTSIGNRIAKAIGGNRDLAARNGLRELSWGLEVYEHEATEGFEDPDSIVGAAMRTNKGEWIDLLLEECPEAKDRFSGERPNRLFYNAFSEAVRLGCGGAMLSRLWQLQPDLRIADSKGTLPFERAIRDGNVVAVNFMIDRGASAAEGQIFTHSIQPGGIKDRMDRHFQRLNAIRKEVEARAANLNKANLRLHLAVSEALKSEEPTDHQLEIMRESICNGGALLGANEIRLDDGQISPTIFSCSEFMAFLIQHTPVIGVTEADPMFHISSTKAPVPLVPSRQDQELEEWFKGIDGDDSDELRVEYLRATRGGQAELTGSHEAALDVMSMAEEFSQEQQQAKLEARLARLETMKSEPAQYIEIFSPTLIKAFERRCQAMDAERKVLSYQCLTELRRNQGQRAVVRAPSSQTIRALKRDFPSFEEVIETVARSAEAAARLDPVGKPFKLRNILLVGEPGTGKTTFLKALAGALGTACKELPMGQVSAGFLLSGLSSSYSGSQPGAVFDLLANGDCANPCLILDELDKINPGDKYPIPNCLYALGELGSSKEFQDEFIGSFNASHINLMASANSTEQIEPALLSRFQVFNIKRPSEEQVQSMVGSIYREVLNRRQWSHAFAATPSESVVALLRGIAGLTPRNMVRMIDEAVERAAIEGFNELLEIHFLPPASEVDRLISRSRR